MTALTHALRGVCVFRLVILFYFLSSCIIAYDRINEQYDEVLKMEESLLKS